jgi:hypothetical protein
MDTGGHGSIWLRAGRFHLVVPFLVSSLATAAYAQSSETEAEIERDAVKWVMDQAQGYRQRRRDYLSLNFADGGYDILDRSDFLLTGAQLPDGCRVGVSLSRRTNARDGLVGGIVDADLEKLSRFRKLATLSIDSQHFTGEGLVHLAALPELHTLSLNGPGLTDAGLEKLGSLQHLRVLRVRHQLQPKALQVIGSMQELEELNINIEKDGLAELARLPKLRDLEFFVELTPENARDLEKLQQLEHVSSTFESDDESGRYFATCGKLQKLRAIEIFDPFNQTALRQMATALALRQLSLDLTSNGEDKPLSAAGLDSLAALTQIQTLEYTGPLNDELLLSISRMTDLRELDLNRSSSEICEVTAEGWSHLKALQFLTTLTVYTGELELSAEDAQQLTSLPNLKSLSVDNVTDASLVELAKAGQIREFSFFGDSITERGFSAVSQMDNLESLVWTVATAPDEGLAKLAALKNLKEFSISGNYDGGRRLPKLSRRSVEQIASMSAIESLQLTWLENEPADLEPLARLDRLKGLTLDGHELNDAHLAAIPHLKSLKTLTLEGTAVSSQGVAGLKKQCPELRVQRSRH